VWLDGGLIELNHCIFVGEVDAQATGGVFVLPFSFRHWVSPVRGFLLFVCFSGKDRLHWRL